MGVSLVLLGAPLTGGEARAVAEPAPAAEVGQFATSPQVAASDPVPMPRVRTRGPAPLPMPRAQLRGRRPVPMPHVQLPDDVPLMPELQTTPKHPRLRLK